MRAFLYAAALQWRLDIRSKTLLITCYVVPLLFFAFMGSVFTAVNPEMQHTLIPSMSVMGVSMAALIGLPPSIVETYAGDIKKMYTANGRPGCASGLAAMYLSAFAHLTVMCISLYLVAPLLFGAARPASAPAYFGALAVFIAVSLSVGCVLGLVNRNQAKSTMFSQIVFLPSILLSGILFPRELLPEFLQPPAGCSPPPGLRAYAGWRAPAGKPAGAVRHPPPFDGDERCPAQVQGTQRMNRITATAAGRSGGKTTGFR